MCSYKFAIIEARAYDIANGENTMSSLIIKVYNRITAKAATDVI